MLSRVAAVLLVALFVLPLGALGASDHAQDPNAAPLGTGSRAGGNVTVNGTIRDASNHPPWAAYVLALNATNWALINYNITFTGNYSISLAKNDTYIIYMVPFSGANLGGYSLHGFFPIARYVVVKMAPVKSNFTITPAYELVLKGTDANHALVNSSQFTNTRWSTKLDDRNAFAIWDAVDNGLGTKLPVALIPLNEARDLWFQWLVPGYGNAVVHIDNNGTGYKGLAQGARFVDVNADLAYTQRTRENDLWNKYYNAGYNISDDTSGHVVNASYSCDQAQLSTGTTRLDFLDKCSAEAVLAVEDLELDRAQKDIETNRKGVVNVTVKDATGLPVEGAVVTYNETSHDFLFGVFDNLKEAGLQRFQQCHDIGVNYATSGFYWTISEPTEGNIQYQLLNDSWGIKVLTDMGYTLHAHALIYMMDLVTPTYMRAKDFNSYNASVYQHVFALVNAYKDRIHIWNVVNEASGKSASGGFTKPQVLQIIKTGVKAIRDADPDGQIIVNNPFDWFGQSGSMGYLIENFDNYTISITDYIDLLKSEGVTFDIIGQQMYNGGYSSFFEKYGIGPGMPVSTMDLGFQSYVFDSLSKYNKTIYLSELSVSGMWNNSWKDAGYWHAKWDPNVQAEYLRAIYTIGFSKEKVQSLTWWDLDDNTSFLDGGALFDTKMRPKPAFYAMKDLIASWTTNANGTTDQDGGLGISGFAGNYNITVTWKGHTKLIKQHIDERKAYQLDVTFTEDVLKPDLVIHPYEAQAITSDYNTTGHVQVNAIVRNEGDKDAINITVRLVTGSLANATVLNETILPSLAKGAYRTVGFNWNASEVFGNQTVYLLVDPANKVPELNESNNNATIFVELPIPNWGHLKISVTSATNGMPLANATVRVLLLNGTQYAQGRVGTDGNVTFRKVPLGCYKVTAEKQLFLPGNVTACTKTFVTVVATVRLTQITWGGVTGAVSDNDTLKGMAGVWVRLAELNMTTQTSLDGSFAFLNIPVGTYNITATAPGYLGQTNHTTIIVNQTVTLNLWLRKAVGILQGTVKDSETGRPVANATLMLGNIMGQKTDAKGLYIFVGVPADGYSVYVSAEGYEARSVSVFISAQRTTWMNTTLVPIHQPPDLNGTISGFVLDAKNDSPIPRAHVKLVELNRELLTDDNGFYKFDKVPPGTYTINVTAKDHTSQTISKTLGNNANVTASFHLDRSKGNGTDMSKVYLSWGLMIVFLAVLAAVVFLVYRRVSQNRKEKAKGDDEDEEAAGGAGEEE